MTEYTDIVVAVDGSETSEKAFEKALHIAQRNNARMILAHVIDSRTFDTVQAYDRTLTERDEHFAKELLDRYTKNAKNAGVIDLVRIIQYGSQKVKIAKDSAKKVTAD